ncbi:MAG: S8 family serine peptidase [Bacteroidota bacterium]
MKRLVLLLFLFCLYDTALAYDKYWVEFTDKNGTPYSTGNPSAFLSSRSIQRRQNQGIPVTQRDLPVNPSYVQQVLATGAVNLRYTSRWFNAMSIQTTDTNALNAIAALPFVSSVQAVMRYYQPDDSFEEFYESLDANKSSPQGGFILQPLAYNYGPSFNQINMIGGDCMHNMGYHGEGMVIAVLDAGFYQVDILPAFDSLRTNGQILGTWDFVAGNASVYEDNAHGEMVLSCMGGYLDGQLVGTAPKAKYWLFRTEDAGTEYLVEEDNWVAAAEFADSVGADIINTSLGYTTFDDAGMNHTYNDMDGNTCRISICQDYAAAVGMFPVCSAGNSGSSSWFYIGAPADADSVLAVGAVDATGTLASFSSRGPSSDGRVKPNVCAQGVNAIVAAPSGGTQTANGTSFSSPITCGAVACLWQANPTFSIGQLFNAIQMSATQFSSPDSLYGYGIPNFCLANVILNGGSLDNFQDDHLMNTWPNPFNEEFSFTFYSTRNQTLVIEMYDVTGRMVLSDSREVKENSITNYKAVNLSTLATGMYFLKITTPTGKYTVKMMKG